MTWANVKNGQQKNGKFTTKLTEKIPWNKLCVVLISPYKMIIKGREPIILKAVTKIYPVTMWFEINKYNDKKEIMIVNLVETMWLV